MGAKIAIILLRRMGTKDAKLVKPEQLANYKRTISVIWSFCNAVPVDYPLSECPSFFVAR